MKIIEVTDLISDVENLNDNIPKHKATVMVYMMKNCPHCENLKPKWDMVKTQMNNDTVFNDVLSADIDSSATPMLSMPPVIGFPTIRVLKEGKLHEYNGNREVDPILSYIKKLVRSPQIRQRSHRRTHRKTHRKTPRSLRRSMRQSHRQTKRKTPRSVSLRRTNRKTQRKTPRTSSMRNTI